MKCDVKWCKREATWKATVVDKTAYYCRYHVPNPKCGPGISREKIAEAKYLQYMNESAKF